MPDHKAVTLQLRWAQWHIEVGFATGVSAGHPGKMPAHHGSNTRLRGKECTGREFMMKIRWVSRRVLITTMERKPQWKAQVGK